MYIEWGSDGWLGKSLKKKNRKKNTTTFYTFFKSGAEKIWYILYIILSSYIYIKSDNKFNCFFLSLFTFSKNDALYARNRPLCSSGFFIWIFLHLIPFAVVSFIFRSCFREERMWRTINSDRKFPKREISWKMSVKKSVTWHAVQCGVRQKKRIGE